MTSAQQKTAREIYVCVYMHSYSSRRTKIKNNNKKLKKNDDTKTAAASKRQQKLPTTTAMYHRLTRH